MIEADDTAQNGDQDRFSPLLREGRSKTVLLFRCSGGLCGGIIATAVRRRKVHDI